MGNKNTSPHKGLNTGATQKEEGASNDGATGSVCRDGPPGPSPELLASLQALGDSSDDTLLPQSLHQIALACSLKEDYQWAVQFLQLEKLYHERLLSNLAALQDNWESQWRERRNTESSLPAESNSIGQEHIETLSQICKTHQRPSLNVEKITPNAMLKDLQSIVGPWDKTEIPPSHNGKDNKPETTHQDEGEAEQSVNAEPEQLPPHTDHQGQGEEEEGGEEETYEEGQEVGEEEEEEEDLCEETPEEEEVKVEWPTGVPQASAKDLAKLSHTEGSSSPDGLVSILKRRRASLDGLPPPGPAATKNISKRKVRFSEPEDGIEQDEVGGDSCLILLLLCLVTVVISIGGTALYCTLVDTYSNICTDFSHNVDFYVMNVRRFFDELRHWLPFRT
ncbi:consortin, connexin sorting protein b [Myripristis murdjan]|uniref:consortin, connexin sorting protein b n=1 Tax=Myripristis murdjan TaxID=586833 RepID=UPI0011762D5D|nr:consortin-like [Myripristis murdjan]